MNKKRQDDEQPEISTYLCTLPWI